MIIICIDSINCSKIFDPHIFNYSKQEVILDSFLDMHCCRPQIFVSKCTKAYEKCIESAKIMEMKMWSPMNKYGIRHLVFPVYSFPKLVNAG